MLLFGLLPALFLTMLGGSGNYSQLNSTSENGGFKESNGVQVRVRVAGGGGGGGEDG